jgi:hypothetical protein
MARWLLLLLTACGTGPECVSPCGVKLFGRDDCDAFAAYEARALDALAVTDLPVHCGALDNWSLFARVPDGLGRGDSWYSPHVGMRVAGLTWCQYASMEIATVEWPRTAMTHEFVHALEACKDPHHETWQDRGIYEAIWTTTGGLDGGGVQ